MRPAATQIVDPANRMLDPDPLKTEFHIFRWRSLQGRYRLCVLAAQKGSTAVDQSIDPGLVSLGKLTPTPD